MRRLVAFVVVLTLVPATAALATDLDQLMNRSQGASYTAEQTISCSTPDGVRDAVVRLTQVPGQLMVSSSVTDDVAVATGSGVWSLRQGGGHLEAEAAVSRGSGPRMESIYAVAETRAVEYLNRDATSYLVTRNGEPRAELIFDDETGALVDAETYTSDGRVYCSHRFISLDTAGHITAEAISPVDGTEPVRVGDTVFPADVDGFERRDQYEDADGFRFAYYSDGFFSFAIFQTPAPVDIPAGNIVDIDHGMYTRAFTAGQVTYAWDTGDGGMALVGDLPPDLHAAILSAMPKPESRGFLRRWWRNLFG